MLVVVFNLVLRYKIPCGLFINLNEKLTLQERDRMNNRPCASHFWREHKYVLVYSIKSCSGDVTEMVEKELQELAHTLRPQLS